MSPRSTLRRAAAVAVVAALVAACGDSDERTSGTSDTAAPTTTAAPATTPPPTATPAPGSERKPEVEIPDEIPTELVVTDLTTGTGREAQAGDTVVLDYVGVRSEDGVEFDNSYDRGQPFTLTLGAGGVIPGWDEGLVGVQAGGQRQLDIPADLAYGDEARGDVIRAGDALTFVVDVLAVIPATLPEDAPDVSVAPAANVDQVETTDLVVGDGPELEEGQIAVAHLIAYRADTGEELLSSWSTGTPEQLQYAEGETLPGLFEGLEGVRVGGRRQIAIPYEAAFGDTGNESIGLPPDTDLVLVVDVLAAF